MANLNHDLYQFTLLLEQAGYNVTCSYVTYYKFYYKKYYYNVIAEKL